MGGQALRGLKQLLTCWHRRTGPGRTTWAICCTCPRICESLQHHSACGMVSDGSDLYILRKLAEMLQIGPWSYNMGICCTCPRTCEPVNTAVGLPVSTALVQTHTPCDRFWLTQPMSAA